MFCYRIFRPLSHHAADDCPQASFRLLILHQHPVHLLGLSAVQCACHGDAVLSVWLGARVQRVTDSELPLKIAARRVGMTILVSVIVWM